MSMDTTTLVLVLKKAIRNAAKDKIVIFIVELVGLRLYFSCWLLLTRNYRNVQNGLLLIAT